MSTITTTNTTEPIAVSPTVGTHRLLISCPDRPGVVAAVAKHLFDHGANITRSDQYSSDPPEHGTFFLRMEFDLGVEMSPEFIEHFGALAERFEMNWRVWSATRPKRVAVLVSREDHCLQDLLYRWRRGEFEAEIVLVASNHPHHRESVEALGLPYHHVPVASKELRPAAEQQLLEVLEDQCDLVVLARYMQILSGDFLRRVGVPVINIHHSFLPAFAGAGPYERAKERGVKLIGATAHYVTEELDAGPIIEQDVNRVTHRDRVDDLKRLGADIERTVLSRGVAAHCADRVLRLGNTTVVF